MIYKYTVNRYNGEKTYFDFCEDNRNLDEIASVLKGILPEPELHSLSFNRNGTICRDLIDGSGVSGTWLSTDLDPFAAAVDIQTRIRQELDIETQIEMFDPQGNEIKVDCSSGKFFVKRRRSSNQTGRDVPTSVNLWRSIDLESLSRRFVIATSSATWVTKLTIQFFL